MTDGSPHRLPTDTENGMLLVISGPSGVGKTTIARAVERSIADAAFSISATTRARTEKDVDGVDYHFMTPEQFERREKAGEFIETAEYAGNKYGTLLEPVEVQLERGRLVILEIEVQGAQQVKAKKPEAFAMFVLPPSEETLLQRLRDRGREDEEKIQRRFAIAKSEIEQAKACGIYDAFVVNTVLDDAIEEAVALVRSARKERA